MKLSKININIPSRPLETFIPHIFNYDYYLENIGKLSQQEIIPSFDLDPTINPQYSNLLGTTDMTPNLITVNLNTVLLTGQGSYDTRKWKQNDVNYITRKISSRYEFISYDIIRHQIFTLDSKIDNINGILSELERNLKFVEEVNIRNGTILTDKYFTLKIPRNVFMPIPMLVKDFYYKDTSSELMAFVKRPSIVENYDVIYRDSYKFNKPSINNVERLKFKMQDGMFIYLDHITRAKTKYWEFSLNIYLDDVINPDEDIKDMQTYLVEIISEFLGYFREESLITKTFMSELYKTPLKYSKDSVYFGNPIKPHTSLNYNHLFYKSYDVSSIIAYPNPVGIFVELLISSNFFIIIIEYSTYIKRYYLKDSDDLIFDGSYMSYKCILYSETNLSSSDVFDILMFNNNNEVLNAPLELLVIEKLYSFKDNIVTELNITRDRKIKIPENISEMINNFGFRLHIVKYNKTLNDIMLKQSIHDYYADLKEIYPNINGLNFYNSIGDTYIIHEDLIYNLVINDSGNAVVTNKYEDIQSNIYDVDVLRNILLQNFKQTFLVDKLLVNVNYYFVYQLINDKIDGLSIYLSRRSTESKIPKIDDYLCMNDFSGLHLNDKYISYKTNLMLKDINKYNLNVIIYINPEDIVFNKNRTYILIEPSKNLIIPNDSSINILILDDYYSSKNILSEFMTTHRIKTYALIFYNIYENKYFEIFGELRNNASYVIAMDYFISNEIEEYNIWNYRWSDGAISHSEDDSKIIIINSGEYVVEYSEKDYIKIYKNNILLRNINNINSRMMLDYLIKFGGISITNDIKLNIPADNIYRLLSKQLEIVVIKQEILSLSKTMDKVLELDDFRIMRNGSIISFNIIKIQGILESITYAIFGNFDQILVEDMLHSLTNLISLVDLNMPPMERNMGFGFQRQFIYLSNLYKINFAFYDINNPNLIELEIGSYSKTIYFITDKVDIYPITQGYGLIEYI